MKKLSDTKMNELIQRIKDAPEISSSLARRIIVYLASKSENCSKPVAISIYPIETPRIDSTRLAMEVFQSVHDISSTNGTTRINAFLKENDSKMWFSGCLGCAYKDGKVISKKDRESHCTLWFGTKMWGMKEDITVIELNMEEILRIEVPVVFRRKIITDDTGERKFENIK
jgi:hypothetical protein